MAVSLTVGEKFSSYGALQSKIELYQRSNSVQLYKRSSRSIDAAKSRCTKRSFNDSLKFAEVTYSCIHGGKNFRAKGTGKRNQSTFQMGCKAEIKLRATADGQHLEVRSFNELHNHETDNAVFRTLPQQRRLETHEQEHIANMLSVKANNKMIQQRVMNDTGKFLLLKDIHNLRTKLKTSNKDVSTLQSAIDQISKCNGAYVKLVTNENSELRGLFFQDARMRDIFQTYPEFLCIDATYKVNDLRMPLYILLIENGNGQSEVVGMWLVADETEEMMTEMVRLFKDQNPSWDKVQTVMSDKDFVEREVFKKELPQAKLKICLFHVLRTFRREITCEKIGANKRQRDNILEILQKLAYSSSLDQYETNKALLVETQNAQAIEYFSQSWDPIKDQWVIGLATSCSLGNNTNNRLESINQKIKQVVDKNAKFDDFAQDILVFLNIHRTELNGKLCRVTAKVPIIAQSDTSVAADYRKELTEYAFSLVEKQMKWSEEVELELGENGCHKIKNTDYIVTDSKCECAFNVQYQLPCKHIFSLRKLLQMNQFDKSLINERWSKRHYLGTFRSYQHDNHVAHSVLHSRARVESQQQRYRTAYHTAQKLASCAAEVTGQMFDVRLHQMTTMLRSWERGEEVVIETTNSHPGPSLDIATTTEMPPPLSTDVDYISPRQTPQLAMTVDDAVELSQPQDISTVDESSEVAPMLMDSVVVDLPENNDAIPSNDILASESATSSNFVISASSDVCSIKLPPKIKKRGRPKGSELTVVGLPKKRLKLKRKPIPFCKLETSIKDKIMLKWFVDDEIADRCIASDENLITEEEVISCPERINMAATETCIDCIEKYFETNAWVAVLNVLERAKARPITCKVCNDGLETRCICCDLCLGWYHYHCAAISDTPRTKLWFCIDCSR